MIVSQQMIITFKSEYFKYSCSIQITLFGFYFLVNKNVDRISIFAW